MNGNDVHYDCSPVTAGDAVRGGCFGVIGAFMGIAVIGLTTLLLMSCVLWVGCSGSGR